MIRNFHFGSMLMSHDDNHEIYIHFLKIIQMGVNSCPKHVNGNCIQWIYPAICVSLSLVFPVKFILKVCFNVGRTWL